VAKREKIIKSMSFRPDPYERKKNEIRKRMGPCKKDEIWKIMRLGRVICNPFTISISFLHLSVIFFFFLGFPLFVLLTFYLIFVLFYDDNFGDQSFIKKNIFFQKKVKIIQTSQQTIL